MSEEKTGQTVSVHYVGTFDDGTQFDSSRERDEPLTFQLGAGQMIPGFDSIIKEMIVGETKTVRLDPEDAYGASNPELVQSVPRSAFDPNLEIRVGAVVQGSAPDGQVFMAKIESTDNDSVVLDLNHPMAGKHLNFEVELLTSK